MWKWLIRFLSVSYFMNRWRHMPPWARGVIAMVLVLIVSTAALGLVGILRYVSGTVGLGWAGVAGILSLAGAVGSYFWLDIPGRRARALSRRRAQAADDLLALLPDPADVAEPVLNDLSDEARIQDRIRALVRSGRFDDAEVLLNEITPRFEGQAWPDAFRRQINLRR